MNKIIITFTLLLVLVGGFLMYDLSNDNIQGGEDNMEEVYQGPVPQGYDLGHFRKTGETIKKVTIKNPATGEVWNSIEEFENRKFNLMGVNN